MNKNSSKLLTKNYYVLETWMAPVAFLIVFIFNCFFTPNFASWFTIRNIFTQSTSTVLIAIGMTMVISAGAIDISVGSGYAFRCCFGGDRFVVPCIHSCDCFSNLDWIN